MEFAILNSTIISKDATMLTIDPQEASNARNPDTNSSVELHQVNDSRNTEIVSEREILPFPEMEFDFDDLEAILDT
jgi:hypothetical protein